MVTIPDEIRALHATYHGHFRNAHHSDITESQRNHEAWLADAAESRLNAALFAYTSGDALTVFKIATALQPTGSWRHRAMHLALQAASMEI